MQQTKTLIENTLIYSVGNFGAKFLTFLLLPVYTYFLSKSELGYFDLVVVTTTLIIPFVSFQLSEGAYRWLLGLKDPADGEAEEIVTNSFLFILASLLVCVLLFYTYHVFRPFSNSLLLILFCASHCFLPYFLQVARGLGKNKLYAFSGILNAFVLFVSNLVLLVGFKMGVQALLISVALANCITILVVAFRTGIFRMVAWKYLSPALTGRLIRYSVPLIPNVVAWWLIDSVNRYLILHYLGQDSNGVYALAGRFPTLLVVLNSIFYLSWQESAILEYESADRDAFYSKVFKRFFILEMTAVIFFIAISRVLVTGIVDARFGEAWQYTPLLFLSVAFSSFSAFWGTGYLSSKNTMGAFTTTVFGAIVNIGMSILLIPRMGLYGAALGTTAGFLAIWLIRILSTRKYFRIRLPVLNIILYGGLSIAFLLMQLFVKGIPATVLMIAAALAILVLANKNMVLVHLLPMVRNYLKKSKHGQ